MEIVVFAFIALLGLVIGSFLNVVIHRIPLGQSVVSPRSSCPKCQTPVSARDNIPVFSWLLLRGRCRNCGESISPRYIVVEVTTAVVFLVLTAIYGIDSKELLLALPFATMLIAVAEIDREHRIVPNKILIVATVWAVVVLVAFFQDDLAEHAIASLAAGGFFLIAALAYPGGMGMGDVKLAAVMGLYLGSAVSPAIFIAMLLGVTLGVVLIARDGQEARKRAIPFAPFLAAGGLMALFFGPEIIDWYSNSFL